MSDFDAWEKDDLELRAMARLMRRAKKFGLGQCTITGSWRDGEGYALLVLDVETTHDPYNAGLHVYRPLNARRYPSLRALGAALARDVGCYLTRQSAPGGALNG